MWRSVFLLKLCLRFLRRTGGNVCKRVIHVCSVCLCCNADDLWSDSSPSLCGGQWGGVQRAGIRCSDVQEDVVSLTFGTVGTGDEVNYAGGVQGGREDEG